MNRFRNLIAVFAFSLLILGLPSLASAQYRNNRDNDDYYGNNRNNRNLNATIKNLKNRSHQFEHRLIGVTLEIRLRFARRPAQAKFVVSHVHVAVDHRSNAA